MPKMVGQECDPKKRGTTLVEGTNEKQAGKFNL